MDASRKLGLSIIKHLQLEFQNGNYPESKSESLEVAIQCLEQAYDIDLTELSRTSHLECGKSLLDIFTEATNVQASVQPTEDDIANAEYYKTEGNDFVKAEKYHQAVESYSMAISIDGSNAVYYCNRAAAHTKLGNNKDAIDDCEKAAAIDPKYSKAYGRMGLAYLNLENYQKSVECYEKALHLESTNQSYENNLLFAREKLNEKKHAAGMPGGMPGGMPNLGGGGGGLPNLGGLDVGALLSNPAVMNMAQNFMQNPQMQNMFSSLMGGMSSGGASPPDMSTDTNETSGTDYAASATSSGASSQPSSQPGQMDFTEVLSATQQFAQQMQRDNPELVEQLRTQFQQGGQPPKPEEK